MSVSLYTEAIEALIQDNDFYEYQSELLIDPATYWDKMPPASIRDKKIVFVTGQNEEKLFQENNNVIEILSLEPPRIDGDELMIKINHTLSVKTNVPLDENSWPKNLTAKDRRQIKEMVMESERINPASEVKTIRSAIHTRCSYVKFRFDNTERRFKVVGIEVTLA